MLPQPLPKAVLPDVAKVVLLRKLVPAALKGTFNVSIIGQRSGGGSCIVLPCTTASGAQFQISGTSQISTIKNGSFYNADTGIEVDANITDINTMYDREKLVEFIHGLK